MQASLIWRNYSGLSRRTLNAITVSCKRKAEGDITYTHEGNVQREGVVQTEEQRWERAAPRNWRTQGTTSALELPERD